MVRTIYSRSDLFRIRHYFVYLLSAVLIGCSTTVAQTAEPRDTLHTNFRLGVVIVVDQMRPDYLTRFADLYTGGLARLTKTGILFTNAYHAHAATETAVGHTAISTGRFPGHNGIVGNDFFDRENNRTLYACEDSTAKILGNSLASGRSPRLLQVDAIGDWLRGEYASAKVYSVALKDRAAILLGGIKPDGAFWYDRTSGNFETSTYYMQRYPAWVDTFNTRHAVDSFFTVGWHKLFPDSFYTRSHADSFPGEGNGKNIVFPHSFDTTSGHPNARYYDAVYGTPFGDQLALSFARAMVANTEMGKDSIPDLLLISCSSADAIGHAFGPNSQEIEDYYLRLDKCLDTLFTFLDSAVGHAYYTVTLSSDHGVLPLPEDLVAAGIPARRLSVDTVVAAIKAAGATFQTANGLSENPIAECEDNVLLNYTSSRMKGMSDATLQNMVAAALRKIPFIADAYSRDELQSGTAAGRPYADLYINTFNPLHGPDIFLRFPEYTLVTSSPYGTSHGTPYSYDTDVPIVFEVPSKAPAVVQDRVKTVDIAPTLAILLGVMPPDGIDGTPLTPVVGQISIEKKKPAQPRPTHSPKKSRK